MFSSSQIKENVVQFHVPMSIALTMHICHTFYDLPEYVFASALWESCLGLLLDMMEYAHTLTKFHHEMNMSSLIYYFMKFHYIWMIKLRECVDFSVHSL